MVSLALHAQKDRFFPALTLRSSPLTFLETDANVTLGLGVQVSPRVAINIDPAYVLYNVLLDTAVEFGKASGVKLRTELRYYLRDFIPYQSRRLALFVAAEGHYKKVRSRKEDNFGFNFQNGAYEYFMRSSYTERKEEKGGIIKFGGVKTFGSSMRWLGEFYGGIGVRTQKFRYSDLPLNGLFAEEPDPLSELPYFNGVAPDPDAPTIMLSLGIKIAYRLGKKKP